MKTMQSAGFVVSAVVLAASCGCSTAPTITRGQNPISDSAVTPASHGHGGPATHGAHAINPSPHEAMVDHFRYNEISKYKVDENGQVVPYHYHSDGHYADGNCRSCPPNPSCPHCRGCPPEGHACPQCQHGDDGCWDHDYPKHHFTYQYIRPKNVVNAAPGFHGGAGVRYPAPGIPGGAVVYPYYTHKGPSDFFRTE